VRCGIHKCITKKDKVCKWEYDKKVCVYEKSCDGEIWKQKKSKRVGAVFCNMEMD